MKAIALSLAVLASASVASANTVIFQDTYEQYTLAPGGNGNWASSYATLATVAANEETPQVGTYYTNGTVGTVIDDTQGYYWRFPGAVASTPNTGSQYLWVGTDGNSSRANLDATSAAASQGQQVLYSFDVYVQNDEDIANGENEGVRFAPFQTGVNPFFDLTFGTDGTVHYFLDSGFGSFSTDDITVDIEQWVHVEVLADYANTEATLTIGGNSVAVPLRASTSTRVDGIIIGGYGGEFHVIDNVTATVVPEPASLGLIGLGAVAMLRRRR